jgi:hypothetical protein
MVPKTTTRREVKKEVESARRTLEEIRTGMCSVLTMTEKSAGEKKYDFGQLAVASSCGSLPLNYNTIPQIN